MMRWRSMYFTHYTAIDGEGATQESAKKRVSCWELCGQIRAASARLDFLDANAISATRRHVRSSFYSTIFNASARALDDSQLATTTNESIPNNVYSNQQRYINGRDRQHPHSLDGRLLFLPVDHTDPSSTDRDRNDQNSKYPAPPARPPPPAHLHRSRQTSSWMHSSPSQSADVLYSPVETFHHFHPFPSNSTE